ncbi:MAG TPA: HEAT repeat domain-containing protein [Terriglobales bacterium]|nr:HEAT repeat domain-containing protein [Terriglobales bacterium]
MSRLFWICVVLMVGALPLASQEAQPKPETPTTETTEPKSAKPEAAKPQEETKPETTKPESIQPATTKPADIREQAWSLLREGVKDEKTEHRATAVRVLSLLPGEPEAIKLACEAMADPKPEVRAAAAMAMGPLHATKEIPHLKDLLDDKEVSVVVAAAHSLVELHDARGYDVYYAILTGQRKGKGLIESQMDTLKDAHKMALLGFQEGIGFIPFAGIGYSAYKTISKDDSTPIRAAAVKVLADDPDPAIEDDLLDTALNDKSELVRAAAIDAIARRNKFSMVNKLVPALSDSSDPVKYTAAAAILHLHDVVKAKSRKKK